MMFRGILICCVLLCSACEEQQFESLLSPLSAKPIADYNEARKIFWKSLYPTKGNTLYCGKSFISNQRDGINIEHVFPMSWAINGLHCGTRKQCRIKSAQFNKIEADLHNLYPSRSDVNQQRSSYRFGEVSGEKRRFGKQCDFEVDTYKRVAEPAVNVRGDVARAMFYMADRYKEQGLVIFEKQARMLYKWHQADDPSDLEKHRNDVIEKLQGNRNPFIDTPEKLGLLIENGYFF